MSASWQEVQLMIEEAKAEGAEYLIIGRDPMDNSSFPEPVMPGRSPREALDELLKTGNDWDECYDLTGNTDAQMHERRAQHLDHEWQKKTAT